MGKGDKKTKRGKIIIGSAGVTRSRKKKRHTAPVASKTESKPKKVAEEPVVAAQVAPKKTKKAEEPVITAEEKPKSPKSKKKTTEADSDTAAE